LDAPGASRGHRLTGQAQSQTEIVAGCGHIGAVAGSDRHVPDMHTAVVTQNRTQVGVGVVAVEAQKAPPRQGLVAEQASPTVTVPSGTHPNTDIPPEQMRSHFCPAAQPVCPSGSHAAAAPSLAALPLPPQAPSSASAQASRHVPTGVRCTPMPLTPGDATTARPSLDPWPQPLADGGR
jgi:hypothetical protein